MNYYEQIKDLLISNEIFSYENIEMVNDMIVDNIIFDNTVYDDMIHLIRELNMDEIATYVKPKTNLNSSWEDVPEDIKNTFDRLRNSRS